MGEKDKNLDLQTGVLWKQDNDHLCIDRNLEVPHLDIDLGAILLDIVLGTAPIQETILLEEQDIADFVDRNHHLQTCLLPQNLIVEGEDVTREHFPRQKKKCSDCFTNWQVFLSCKIYN